MTGPKVTRTRSLASAGRGIRLAELGAATALAEGRSVLVGGEAHVVTIPAEPSGCSASSPGPEATGTSMSGSARCRDRPADSGRQLRLVASERPVFWGPQSLYRPTAVGNR
jgi:hypothetical protein